MPETSVIDLPERLDARATFGLAELLLAHKGSDVVFDASRVAYVGAISLQLFIMAQRQWSADGKCIEFSTVSPAFDQGLFDLGTNRESLMKGDFQ